MKNSGTLKINWTDLYDSDNLSLTKYIESNSRKIKKEIFHFIKKLKCKNKSLNFYDINLWEMSSISELNSYKTRGINDIIKFFTLIILLDEHKPKKLILVNVDSKIKKLIVKSNIKNQIKIQFENTIKSNSSIKQIIPNILKGIFFYINFIRTNFHSLFFSPQSKSFQKYDVILVGYFANFEKDEIINNKKTSKSWGKLPSLLKEHNITPYFLNIFTKSKLFPKSKKAHQFLKNDLNHGFVYSYINLKDLIQIFIYYIKFYFRYNEAVKKIEKDFIFSGYNLFYFFEAEVQKSLKGSILLDNLIWIKSFKNFFESIKTKINLIYVQENQSLEIPLNKFFKKTNTGKLIAWQNQFIRKWDLRYYYKFDKSFSPDYFLINSYYSKKLYLDYGYPDNRIYEIEHLRYQNSSSNKFQNISKNSILILGDYDLNDTYRLIFDLTDELKDIFEKVAIKCHPSKKLSSKILKKYNILLEEENLDYLIYKYEYFIATNSSGAVIDLALKGKTPLVYIPDYKLNNSPLGDYEEIMVRNKDELLLKIKSIKSRKFLLKKMIYFDESHKKFKKFIKMLFI